MDLCFHGQVSSTRLSDMRNLMLTFCIALKLVYLPVHVGVHGPADLLVEHFSHGGQYG